MSLIAREFYRFEEFEVRPSQRSFLRNGEKISLSPKTFEVLVCLVSRAGRVILKDELLKEVWPDSFVEESNLTQHIFWIRKALGDRADAVITLPGRGYQFTVPVQVVPELEEEVAVAPFADPISLAEDPSLQRVKAQYIRSRTKISISESVERKPRSRTLILGLAVFATAVITAAVIYGVERWRHRPVPGDHHEVVLADFENTTGDPGFDHALRTLLVIDLNQSPYFVVASDQDTRKILKLMNRSPDDDLTPVVAREVCERLNDQVVLAGIIARFGQSYLITLDASDCSNGHKLVQTKAVARNREDVLKAVDSVTADMRERLGEPIKSLSRQTHPLELQHTDSLEALKLYSLARSLELSGAEERALPLYQRAVELDSKFAAAYLNMAVAEDILRQEGRSNEAIAKAYEYREFGDDPTRLAIIAFYNQRNTGDLHAILRDYQTWTEQYPQQPEAWDGLAQAQMNLGRPSLGVAAGQHALGLAPDKAHFYDTVVHALLMNGQVPEAQKLARESINRKLDTIGIRYWLLQADFEQGDISEADRQIAWAAGTDAEAPFDWLQAYVLLGQGKVRAAIAMNKHALDLYRDKGEVQAAITFEREFAYKLSLLGLTDEAKREVHPVQHDPNDFYFAYFYFLLFQAQTGELGKAQSNLDSFISQRPNDTYQRSEGAPMVRAAIALQKHKPTDAIAAFTNAEPDDLLQDKSDLSYWRGLAYLAFRQSNAAIASFTFDINHPFVEFYDVTLPLSHLGLARAFEMQENHVASRHEYETLFALWKEADPDLPVLRQARAEYARLP